MAVDDASVLSWRVSPEDVEDVVDLRKGSGLRVGPTSENKYGFEGDGDPEDIDAELDAPTFKRRF